MQDSNNWEVMTPGDTKAYIGGGFFRTMEKKGTKYQKKLH